MNGSKRNGSGSISLDRLLALNDEIAALVRAGIPLEKGLTQLACEAPGKLSAVASDLAKRMDAGESLVDILEKDKTLFPPVWRSVVLAGIRSNHLAAALESLSRTGRRAKELRRSMVVALIYPAIVVAVAYSLFVFSLSTLAPAMDTTHQALTGTSLLVLSWLGAAGGTAGMWAWIVPALVVLGVAGWWYRSGRALRSFDGGPRSGAGRYLFPVSWRRRIPSIRQSLLDGRMATFAEVLGLLDEHHVPLPEAIVLAADASGDRQLGTASRSIAERLARGETFTRREQLPSAFPPLLGWSVAGGMERLALRRTLATSAEMYRRRAVEATRWMTLYLPVILTVVIGGGAVLMYGLVVFLPLVSLLYRLGSAL